MLFAKALFHHEAHEGHEGFGDGLMKTLRSELSNGQSWGIAPTNSTADLFVFFTVFAVKYSFLRVLRVLRGKICFLLTAQPRCAPPTLN